ncbi:unnamed protein product, partial [Gongylonema pulchrum]|uniref:SET domain-containing protein n=1 Tax=Gongylonema pulchrum TaxID=637853 RepID=A0A183EKI9_9BILA
ESYSEDSESDEPNSVGASNKKRKKQKNATLQTASIARSYIPESSSRIKVSDGVKRFKFKRANPESNAPTPRDLVQYQEVVDQANLVFSALQRKEPLCKRLLEFEHHPNNLNCVPSCDFDENLSALLEKRSIPVVLPFCGDDEQQPSASAECCTNVDDAQKLHLGNPKQRLPVFQPKMLHYKTKKLTLLLEEQEINEVGCVAYCGGPISTIESCPRKLEDGRECVAVSVFHDEEYLVPKNQNSQHDYIQFWLYENEHKR